MKELHCKHFSTLETYLELQAILETGEEVKFLFCQDCLKEVTTKAPDIVLPFDHVYIGEIYE